MFKSGAMIVDCGDVPMTWLDNTVALKQLEKAHAVSPAGSRYLLRNEADISLFSAGDGARSRVEANFGHSKSARSRR